MKESQILKLQLAADGRVWCVNGMEIPAPASDRTALLDGLASYDSLHVRVIGAAFNAPLVVEIYQRYCSPRMAGRLEVASPNICQSPQELNNPTIALYRMRQCNLPASLGGWHQVTELDYPTYAITAQFAKDGKFNDHIRRLLVTHPVYQDLSFIHTLDDATTAELIATVIDPRWFIDTRNPYRLSRLKTYLGLSPRHVTDAVEGKGKGRCSRRCRLVINAWGGMQSMPTATDIEQPANFLWRRYRSAGGRVKGILRASQAFVAYFARAWQHRLVAKSPQHQELFTPKEILQGCEVEAYRQHVAAQHRE